MFFGMPGCNIWKKCIILISSYRKNREAIIIVKLTNPSESKITHNFIILYRNHHRRFIK